MPNSKLEAFAHSKPLTLGVELELQIVSTQDYNLSPQAPDLLRLLEGVKLPGDVKPELTRSMIELSTGICEDHADALAQLREIRDALVQAAERLEIGLAGGGTHAFQQWKHQRIYDAPRFRELSGLYGYLAQQFTIFGQHVHIGCPNGDDALYLLHGLSRYVPHAIALAASSPFVQGSDTGFHSARLNSVFAFPLSGRAPFVQSWHEFGAFFDKMTATGVVQSMKDFYWDIRPKPEFGTVEVRVLDTPLTIEKAAALAGWLQCLARWILTERPFRLQEDDYLVYTFNRFQACRFGPEGEYVLPGAGERGGERVGLRDALLLNFEQLAPHAEALNAEAAIALLRSDLGQHGNDAGWLRQLHGREALLNELVRQQTLLWMNRSPR